MLDNNSEVLSTNFSGPNHCIKVGFVELLQTTSRNPTTQLNGHNGL